MVVLNAFAQASREHEYVFGGQADGKESYQLVIGSVQIIVIVITRNKKGKRVNKVLLTELTSL